MNTIPGFLIVAVCLFNLAALYMAMRELVLNRRFRAAYGSTIEVIEILTSSSALVVGLVLVIHIVFTSTL